MKGPFFIMVRLLCIQQSWAMSAKKILVGMLAFSHVQLLRCSSAII